jgi:hypothetical protein
VRVQSFQSLEGCDPVQVLDAFKAFTQAVVTFLQSKNAEASASRESVIL